MALLEIADRIFCELVRALVPVRVDSKEGGLDELEKRLRFTADVGYGNPGREVVRFARGDGLTTITVNRFVLAGLFGPLPEPYQELAARRLADGDGATAAFLDVFNHRINLLRFWALTRNQPGLSALAPNQTFLVRLVTALVDGSLPGPDGAAAAAHGLSPQCIVALAPLLRHPHRSISVLEAALRHVLRREIRVFPFVGGWIPRRPETYSLLGKSGNRLGKTSVLGTRVWDSGKGIELRIACATPNAFEAILPGGADHTKLRRVVLWLTERRFDVHVVCEPPSTAPWPKLGTGEEGRRLGYTARLVPRGSASREPARFTIFADEESHGAAAA